MSAERIPVEVYAEMTPNPGVMKYVANRRIIATDSVEFRNIEEAKPSPLATKLFHFPFVKEVFISSNFVAITKFDIVEWEDINYEMRSFIADYLQAGNPVLTAAPVPAPGKVAGQPVVANVTPDINPLDFNEVEARIVDIIDEYVTPAVAQDGGNIRFAGYDNKIVKVQLQGACSGCPASNMTLKSGILNILQNMLPNLVDDVEAVNG